MISKNPSVKRDADSADLNVLEPLPARAPGKVPSLQLPPSAKQSAPPIQRKAAPAQASRPRKGDGSEPWMDVAMRPDVFKAPVQRKAGGPGSGSGPVSDGAGRAMPASVQARMENSFGADFSNVRIHEGPQAQALGATAYTQNSDIHFAPGQYRPNSQSGQELLGHELAHVVQQSQGGVQATTQAKGVGINDDPGLEREADEMGARAARGEQAGSAAAAAGGVQRKVAPNAGVVQRDGDDVVPQQATAEQLLREQRAARAQVQEQTRRLTNLEARVATEQQARAELGTSLQQAKQTLTQAQARKDQLQQQIAASNTTIEGATSEVEEARAEKVTVELQQHDLQEDIDQANELVNSLEAQLARQKSVDADPESAPSPDSGASVAPVQAGDDRAAIERRLQEARATQTEVMEQDERLRAAAGASASQFGAAAERLAGLKKQRLQLVEKSARQQQQVEASEAEVATTETRIGQADEAVGQAQAAVQAQQARTQEAEAAFEVASEALLESVVQEAGTRLAELGSMGMPLPVLATRVINAATQEDVQAGLRIALQVWSALPSAATTGSAKTAMTTYTDALVEELGAWVYSSKLRAKKWHQLGRRRELREQLKGAAREVVGEEIHTQIQAGDGSEAGKAYHESLAKREAHSRVKPEVDGFLQEVGTRLARAAVDHHKEALAGIALRGVGTGGALAALQASEGKALVKSRCGVLVDDLYQRSQGGAVAAPVANAPVQNPVGEMRERARDSEVIEQSIEATSSEEAVGFFGKLLDKVVPDPGDGVGINAGVKIPIATDPFGGLAGRLYLELQLNGKAGRGTDGFVTAGVPAIADDPKHLELETAFTIGLKAESGSKQIAGMDVGVNFGSFVRSGGDNTLDAMAAFRYGIYRATPIKMLASAWYGGMKKGRGQHGADHLTAEQRAAATEEEHFRNKGTFVHAGMSGSVSAEAGALGAKGKVSGGGRLFRAYNAETLGLVDEDAESAEDNPHPSVPTTEEEALERRRATRGAIKKSFAASASTEYKLGGQGFGVSAAISGGSLTNWGVELKASLSGAAASAGLSPESVSSMATAMYELEHKLLNAFGQHLDQPVDQELSRSDIADKVGTNLGRAASVGMATATVAGATFAESSLAASLQFGLSGGTWTDRFDLISSTKLATPESLPVFSGSLEKETRLIAAEHQGRGRRAWMSPGVHAVSKTGDQDE